MSLVALLSMRSRQCTFVITLALLSILTAGCISTSLDDARVPVQGNDPATTATTTPANSVEAEASPAAADPAPTVTTRAVTTDPGLSADPGLLQGPPPPDGYRALLPGHNRLDADRINLVFALEPGVSGDPEMFEPLLSWDGAAQLRSGQIVFGVFAIEPFRSNRHLFNLWAADRAAIELDEFGAIPDGTFPDMVSIRMSPDDGRASAQLSQFLGSWEKPADDVEFRDLLNYRKGHIGSLILYANAANFAFEGITLTHELGHALFGLADEYYGDTGEANPEFVSQGEWPNCANSRQQAEEWWGDLDGASDPMLDVWIDESRRLGREFTDDEIVTFRRSTTVDLSNGHDGCYNREGYYRPALSGLMTVDPEPPVFGPVNRRWAERILASYTGDYPEAG